MMNARRLAAYSILLVVALGLTVQNALAEEVPSTGAVVPGLEPFDRMMVDFLRDHHAVGATVAVTRHGRLVYARGFGLADRDDKVAAQPDALFRIASCSKPITSAAVMLLCQQKKLRLTDTPFTMLKIDPVLQPGEEPDPRLAKITVLELLQHRGGFDRQKSGDPMFHSVEFANLSGLQPPAMQEQIIRVMAGRKLDFDPGEKSVYSNFGYCVLGRVVESAAGGRYESFVQKNIFDPMKIDHMRLGRTLLKDRAPGEVKYYTIGDEKDQAVFPPLGRVVPEPYGAWCVEAMDSHGGWIGSAPDLVKFASAWDDPAAGNTLTAETVRQMFDRPTGLAGLVGQKPDGTKASVWYGCGWEVRDVDNGRINTWHNGLLPGTSSLMVRRWDGLDWVVLFNQDRDQDGKILADLIDPLIHRAADQIKQWPAGTARDQAWP